jgi:hypothetical protein
MLHVIKIGTEVDVNDSGFLFDNRLSHSVHRLMCCLASAGIRTIPG